MPSIVAYPSKNDTILVGESARDMIRPIENIVYDSKRFIGRQWNDESVQSDMKDWRFKVVDKNGKPHVQITRNEKEKFISAEEISSEILKAIKLIAKNYLNEDVTHAVITIPANFRQRQKVETIKAAKLAGLNVLKLINEPTAAAIAYGFQNEVDKIVLVYDFGGGTFDVSILKCKGSTYFRCLGNAGHMHLGGQDIDKILVAYVIKEHLKTNPKRFRKDHPLYRRRLEEMCRKQKEVLSFNEGPAAITVEMGTEDSDVIDVKLTRKKFNELILKTVKGTLDYVDKAMMRASLDVNDIDQVWESVSGTSYDNQTAVDVCLYEGERMISSLNHKIGEVHLDLQDGMERRGYPIKYIYEIDSNGILNVTVVEQATGHQAQLRIRYDGSGHTEDDVENIIYEAEKHLREDKDFVKLWCERHNFEDKIHTKKRKIEAQLTENLKAEALKVVSKYLRWSNNLPKPISLYSSKLEEFNDEIDKFFRTTTE
ncbi:hypothetical protein WR25_24637 [Diploscapter pachys]|uniref:Uncharacterized protein n=1 Tax=Diploscapter pachys TaxID=2018661 RepID=A0A2A2JZI1_9BILA|nr:hypothetical protein WR25_24637 [Diploscapter pachys]